MSDFEGCNADEWEEGSLPGGPPLASAPESFSRPIRHTSHFPQANGINVGNGQHQSNSYSPVNGNGLPLGSRNGFRQQFQYRPQIQGLEDRSTGIQARQSTVFRNTVTNTAYESFRRGEQAADSHTFSVTWDTLMSNLPDQGPPASRVARDRLDQISSSTETYIPTPLGNTNMATIYGEGEQVKLARRQLESFEHDIRRFTGVRPSAQFWIKMQALDGRKEHREERQARLQEFLRSNPEDDSAYAFHDYFLWPIDPDLEHFIAEYNSTVMDDIRLKHHCKIQYDTVNGLVHTLAHSDTTLHDVRSRIVNLVRELVARLNQRIRKNLLHLPSGSIYRSRVSLDQDPNTGLFMPTLHGEGLPEKEASDWARLCRRQNRQNRMKVGEAISKSLRTLQVSQMHVRMRVTFGELGFRRHKKPADGQDSHSLDDFCEMVRNERTELQQQGIRSTRGDISGLVDKLNEMEAFSEPQESYAVYFDFKHANSDATLRLQTEFSIVNERRELAVSQSRWLDFQPGAQSELLEVNMLDFENPDWQLHLGAVPFSTNKSTRQHLASFSHNLEFNAPSAGIKAPPMRRSVYPRGNAELTRLSEMVLLRYRFKNTEGIFELRRTDVYDERFGKSSAHPVNSFWAAAYYYPEWDNLLGEYADLKPGDQVSWHRSLATFFPDETSEGDLQGFKKFFREVRDIQELLEDAIADLSTTPVNGDH